MKDYNEVTIERDGQDDQTKDGVVVPLDRINPETLRKLVEEFVTREWSELADADYSLDDKVDQVLQQLKDNRVKVVFDTLSESFNIVPSQ